MEWVLLYLVLLVGEWNRVRFCRMLLCVSFLRRWDLLLMSWFFLV